MIGLLKRLLAKAFWKLAPRKVRDRLNPPYATHSYSQEGEDRILARLFEGQGPGFYVDVGAHHPLRYSNTYIFYLQGWRGINVEARAGSMQLFQRVRPHDINLELAVSDKRGSLTYYEFNDPALNGFHKEIAAKADGWAHFRIIGTREIEAVTLADILDKYLPPAQSIDFLNVDVEGLDEQVLRSNNWDKYRPRVILAEDIGYPSLLETAQSPMSAMLNRYGYDLYCKTMNTLIFRLRSQSAGAVP
ncbi:MAG: hypothetical protein QOH39_2162 [Verrucomicrobiota bacterium]|jgi:FkbM family methyltransferase